MRKSELEFLEKIEEGTDMGMHAINQIMPTVTDNEFMTLINEQYNDYKTVHDECKALIVEGGEQVKPQKKVKKVMSTASIKLNTLMNRSTGHLAEMMISGSTMGINQITKELNEKEGSVDNRVKELADKLLHIEQRNIDNLRSYL